jgi:hypothetical protein
MILREKSLKSRWKTPSPTVQPSDHGCLVQNETRSMGAVDVAQWAGAPSKILANLRTNSSLEVVDVDGVVEVAGEAEEAVVQAVVQKDWGSHAGWLVEVNDDSLSEQQRRCPTQIHSKNTE